jgi:MFS family permease
MELRNKQRIFLSLFFFLSGVAFSSWASRIPTIKNNFEFNDAQLGTILIFMPLASLAGLPISGWLVSNYESRKPMTAGFIMLSIALAFIGFANTTTALIFSICLFSFSVRIFNISVNTQAIALQKQFERKINGSFHGLWSTGGIVGVSISTLFVVFDVSMKWHLLIVSLICLMAPFVAYKFLLQNDHAPSGNKLQFSKPDPYIVYLGLLAFLSAICEGGMFDWNGIYFREVVKEETFTLGFLVFMCCMALSRFASDRIIEKIGMPRTFIMSSALIVIGILLSILFPYFWPCMIGFCLVGFGTAAVIPMVFLLAGSSQKYSPGIAISIIATYTIVGILIGPPLIGYISHAFNLRVSFIAFAIGGLMLIPISQMFFHHQRSLSKSLKS